MSESGDIYSSFGGGSMPNPCSLELRGRVVEAVESGATRREALEWFDVSPSNQNDAAPAENWKHRTQAERKQHLAAGDARGLFVAADCRAARFDAGRNRRGDAQTTDRRQPQRSRPPSSGAAAAKGPEPAPWPCCCDRPVGEAYRLAQAPRPPLPRRRRPSDPQRK
jgi:hypothetical protein